MRVWWSSLSAPRRGLLAVVGVLVLAVAVVLGFVATRGVDIPTAAQDRPGPVLLVPGYGGNRDSLAALAERLRASGRTATVLALPGDGTGDLNAQAAVLDEAVRAAVADGAPSVDLVGYSAGGLVVRLWVAEHGDTARAARRVVTLGAPLHGTRLAAQGGVLVPGACPTACAQLTPGSTLLTGVDRRPIPTALPWLSIWTEDDETVVPPDSARLDGAVNVALQRLCPGAVVAHSALPADPVVTALVLRALGDPDPLTRPAADC